MSDFVEDETTRFQLGYSLITVVLINIAYHIQSMLRMMYSTSLKPLYHKLKHKMCQQQKKAEKTPDPIPIQTTFQKELKLESIEEEEEKVEEPDIEKNQTT